MANNRRFVDRIAFHQTRQAEETAEFEQVMREVKTTKDTATRVRFGLFYIQLRKSSFCFFFLLFLIVMEWLY